LKAEALYICEVPLFVLGFSLWNPLLRVSQKRSEYGGNKNSVVLKCMFFDKDRSSVNNVIKSQFLSKRRIIIKNIITEENKGG